MTGVRPVPFDAPVPGTGSGEHPRGRFDMLDPATSVGNLTIGHAEWALTAGAQTVGATGHLAVDTVDAALIEVATAGMWAVSGRLTILPTGEEALQAGAIIVTISGYDDYPAPLQQYGLESGMDWIWAVTIGPIWLAAASTIELHGLAIVTSAADWVFDPTSSYVHVQRVAA